MRIGIMSDTHGQHRMAAAAIQLLQGHGATYFIHCGDVGSDRVLEHLAGLPAAFVFGNCDYDRPALEAFAVTVGVRCLGVGGTLELADKRVTVAHGDLPQSRRQALNDPQCDYFLQGHTHQPEDARIGRVRVINPGALHRAARKTVALLDLSTDHCQWLEVE